MKPLLNFLATLCWRLTVVLLMFQFVNFVLTQALGILEQARAHAQTQIDLPVDFREVFRQVLSFIGQ